MKTRVGAYCRVSTEKDDQQNSFASQKKYFEEYIKNKSDWEFVNIYADEGITGTSTAKRDDFKRMIQDAEDGKLDLIITKEVSRFARNTVDTLEYTRNLKEIGVGVIFITDNINTLDGDGELRLSIMASIAQEESRKTSERVKWGQKRRMEQGVVFGRELLGYNLENGVLSINKEEADIVKLIFQKYLNEGKGTHVIARELYEEGIKTKRKRKQWSNVMILRVLRNEKYVGDLLQKKTFTPNYLKQEKKYNRGQEETVYIKDHHEPIIDRETWEATQKELKRRSPSEEEKTKYSNRYWCSGKLVCGVCNSRFISRTKKLESGQVYRAWRCHQAAQHGTYKKDDQGNYVGCDLGSVNHIVLGQIIEFILSTINGNKEQIIAELIEEMKKLNKPQKVKDTNLLSRKIDTLNDKKQKIINLVVEGTISKDDMIMMNKQYDTEIENLRMEISKIQDINLINAKQANELQKYIDRIKEIVNDLENQNAEEVYKKTVDKIIVYKDNILEVYLNCRPNPIRVQYKSTGKNLQYDVTCNFLE